uniref:Uncharacterized protein n=1 Tax=Candidatus Kentrum sp. TUN TaxID=2126343 RepID=A0A450ZRP6_9GAMM|nr:MAG: hypothetical protein BECKTUN1418D_GA0071000_10482 [Candidatus Kentron sp. TUN]
MAICFHAHGITFRKYRRGAALLLLLGIIVLVSFGIFLGHPERILSRPSQHAEKTTVALIDAKQALIGWAVSHPNAPGLMPWPDRNTDGNYDGDSDCASLPSNATFNSAFLLGRLPWRGRTNPCEKVHGGLGIDVRDSAEEYLWYAVSRNLIRQYQSPPGYPTINPALPNTALFPWLTVRNAVNTVISDRVAVVILAPDVALSNQDRSGTAPNAENYLDIHIKTGISNAESDGCSDDNPGCGGTDGEEFILANTSANFNDRLVFITIDELLTAVERRVLNEVGKVLNNHREIAGVYPWVSPFAYPIATVLGSVTENGADTSRDLIDSNADFIAASVRPGQVIRNITSGYKGIINTVNSRTRLSLTMDDPRYGEDNRFRINRVGDSDDNDRYEILIDTSGTAMDGSLGNTLKDADRTVNFSTLGIRVGDIVENVTDGTYGAVTDIPDPTSLVLNRLGSDNAMAFDPGDNYEIPRFNGKPNTWEGSLPLHAVGERFRTGFTVAWNIPEGVIKTTQLANNSGYLESLEKTLQCSDLRRLATISGVGETDCDPNRSPVNVPWANGSCSWRTIDSVRCAGRTDWTWYLTGAITGNHAMESLKFEDRNTNFQNMGVETGDIIFNTTDGSRGVIGFVANNELEAIQLYGGTRNNFEIGDKYQIRVATKIIPEKSANCANISDGNEMITCGSRTLVDIGTNFQQNGVRPGDTIWNRSSGWWGIIQEVGQPSVSENTESILRVESMGTGIVNSFVNGDRYTIRSGFVDKRRHAFNLTFTGNAAIDNRTGLRKVETGPNAPLPPQNEIRIQDWDAINQRTVVHAAITTNPTTTRITGKISVSGIQFDLIPSLPSWFFSNNWRKFIYLAISRTYLPGGNGDCLRNNNCLTLKTVGIGGTTIRDNVKALVISAGRETDGSGCLQTRPASNLGQYLEKENVHPIGNFSNFTFEQRHRLFSDACFRDQLKIVTP